MPSRKTKIHIIQRIYQRELGLRSNHSRVDPLKSFAEEKASLPNRNQPCEISGQTRATLLMEFSADGKRIASTHGDHSIRITDIRTGKCTHTLNGHPRTPWCIAFHPSNNDILGSGCLGGEVRIWDLQGGGSEVWHCDDALSIASMTFHPSDNVVVFAISNKLHFWDWTRPEPFAVCMTAHDFEKIRWVKFDRSGHRLLTAIANTSEESFGYDSSRFTHTGAVDIGQLHGNSSRAYQGHRTSRNDDSLMDLRMQWNDSQNALEHSRRLNSARLYAYGVTNQAYRTLDSRLMSEPDASLSPAADFESIINRQRNAAQSSYDAYDFDLRPGPLLLTTSQNSGDWLSMPPLERELEAGDALLSLAADGRQTPSRYVHGLSSDGARQHFLAGDDPLSENLTLLEPGYVEATPSASSYGGSSERTIAASSPPAPGADELSSAAMLEQLIREGGTESDRAVDLDHGVFRSRRRSTEGNLPSDGRLEVDVQPAVSRTEGAEEGHGSVVGLTDVWLNSSRSWEIESSLSTSPPAYHILAEAESSAQNVPMAAPCDAGLDLRLGCLDGEGSDLRNASEHCYAMPASSFERSSASEELDSALRPEDGSVGTSAVSRSPATADWLNESHLNLMSLPSRNGRLLPLSNDDSHEATDGGGSTRTAAARAGETSSARCRVFPVGGAGASAAVTSAAAAASSFSSFGARQDVRSQASRIGDNLRRLRHVQGHDALRANGWTPDHPACNSDPASAGCAVCSGTNLAQIFNSDDPQPSTSRGRASVDGRQALGSLTDEELPVSSLYQYPEVSSSRHDPTGLGRPGRLDRFSSSSRPRLFRPADLNPVRDSSGGDPSHVIPRIEIFPDDLGDGVQSADGRGSPEHQGSNERMRYLEPVVYRPSRFGGSRFATMSERLRERRERINYHVEELRARFGSASAAGPLASGANGNDLGRVLGAPEYDVIGYRGGGSPGFGSGADAVGESIGNEDRDRIVSRLRGYREEMRGYREEMRALRQERYARSYRYYMPNRNLRSGRDSIFSGEADTQSLRVNAALNRAISGALAANGDGSVGSNIGDPTFRIQAWNFMRCQIPDISDSESNVLVRRAKIHNDANVDVSQDGRFICTFTLPARNFSGDITLSVFSLMPENFGECLFAKSFGPNAISVSLSPCNNYVLVGLATKRFTWMFTPKQMVAQVYRLKIPRSDEDSMEHICDITHPCDTDFRAPISMNSARWLLGPGEGLAYGTNRGDLNICRPGFEQIDKPEVNDNLSESVPIRRNLMQMLGITVPQMMNSATQTNNSLRRSAGTQTDRSSQSSSSSLAASSSSSAVATLDGGPATADVDDLNLL